MSANGLDVFDKTLQTTHIWLNEIMAATGADRRTAWHVLGGVLRTLRDRVPIEVAAHLGAELPILVRGLYYDQWRPSEAPERYRSLDEFLERVGENLGPAHRMDPREAAETVLDVLSRHILDGQVRKVRSALPEEIRVVWAETPRPLPKQGDRAGADTPDMHPVTAHPERARSLRT
jgi:uncharacterized protein (DUF2267 family)